MTIYQDSKRIVGSSSTDFSAVILNEDFDYASQTSANNVWVPQNNTSGKRVNVSTDKFEHSFGSSGATTNSNCVYDLGAGNVSETKWVLDFTAVVTSANRPNNVNSSSNFGLFTHSGTTANASGTSEKGVCLGFGNQSYDTKFWAISRTGSEAEDNGFNRTGTQFSTNDSTGTYYIRMVRDGNNVTVSIHTASSRTSANLTEEETVSVTGMTGLRWLGSKNYTSNATNNSYAFNIDDVIFYNDVTSITDPVYPSNVQDNSILVEKDTGKRYWLGQSKVSSNDGTNHGATTGATGKTGSAWDFDGSNDYVASAFTDNLGTQFSVSMWMKFDSKASWDAFLGKGTSDSNEEFIFYIGSGSNCIDGEALDDVRMQPSSECTISPNFTTWYHVTYTIDGTAGSYYVYIGTESGTPTQYTSANTTAETNTAGTQPIYIGGNTRQGSWFDGKFDQILVYNKVLTQSEVNALHNSGSGTTTPDTSGLILYYNFDQTGSTLENQVTTPTWTRDKYPAWYEQTTRDNSVAVNNVSGRPYLLGHQNNTGSSKDTTSVTFLLTKYGTGGNGTLTARIYNSSGALQHTSTNSILVSSITGLMGSTYESVTFNFTGATTENTWVVCLHSTGTVSSGDNFVAAGVDIVTGVTHKVMHGSTSFTTYTDRLITITINGDN